MENTRNETTRSYAGSEGSERETSSPRAIPTIVDRELELARKRLALERRAFEIDISRRELEFEELAIAIKKGTAQREPSKFPTAPSDQQAEAAMAPGHSSSLYTAPGMRPTEFALAQGNPSSHYTAPGTRPAEFAMAPSDPSRHHTAPGMRPTEFAMAQGDPLSQHNAPGPWPAEFIMAPGDPSSVHPTLGERPAASYGAAGSMPIALERSIRPESIQEDQSPGYVRSCHHLDEFRHPYAGRSQPSSSDQLNTMAAPAAESGGPANPTKELASQRSTADELISTDTDRKDGPSASCIDKDNSTHHPGPEEAVNMNQANVNIGPDGIHYTHTTTAVTERERALKLFDAHLNGYETIFRYVSGVLYDADGRKVNPFEPFNNGTSSTSIDRPSIYELRLVREPARLCLQWTEGKVRQDVDLIELKAGVSGELPSGKTHALPKGHTGFNHPALHDRKGATRLLQYTAPDSKPKTHPRERSKRRWTGSGVHNKSSDSTTIPVPRRGVTFSGLVQRQGTVRSEAITFKRTYLRRKPPNEGPSIMCNLENIEYSVNFRTSTHVLLENDYLSITPDDLPWVPFSLAVRSVTEDVLVDDTGNNLPCTSWPKGRVVETIVARDGKFRRATVETIIC